MSEAHFTAQASDRILAKLMEADPSQVIVDISNRHRHLPPEPQLDPDEDNALGARTGGWTRLGRG